MNIDVSLEQALWITAHMTLTDLSDEELAALNNAVCAGYDPQNSMAWEKAKGLFVIGPQPFPTINPIAKQVLHRVVLERFPPQEGQP